MVELLPWLQRVVLCSWSCCLSGVTCGELESGLVVSFSSWVMVAAEHLGTLLVLKLWDVGLAGSGSKEWILWLELWLELVLEVGIALCCWLEELGAVSCCTIPWGLSLKFSFIVVASFFFGSLFSTFIASASFLSGFDPPTTRGETLDLTFRISVRCSQGDDSPNPICFFIFYLLAIVADGGGNNNLDVIEDR
ncbi:hypothetical protein Drorol1_Dr00015377 [Drosera rotundifolia]